MTYNDQLRNKRKKFDNKLSKEENSYQTRFIVIKFIDLRYAGRYN